MKRSDLRQMIKEEARRLNLNENRAKESVQHPLKENYERLFERKDKRLTENYEDFDFYLVYGIPPNSRLKIEDLIFEYMPTAWVNGKAGVRITEKRVAAQIAKALESKGFMKLRIQKIAGGVPKDPTDDFKNMFK